MVGDNKCSHEITSAYEVSQPASMLPEYCWLRLKHREWDYTEKKSVLRDPIRSKPKDRKARMKVFFSNTTIYKLKETLQWWRRFISDATKCAWHCWCGILQLYVNSSLDRKGASLPLYIANDLGNEWTVWEHCCSKPTLYHYFPMEVWAVFLLSSLCLPVKYSIQIYGKTKYGA